jgi:ribosome-associated heat shock protein Hsp15
VLTFPQGNRIRVIRVLLPGERRGPATEAATLYQDEDARPPSPDGAA